MGSAGGSDPWIPYRDCSRGLCNEFCPQWCYIFSSPPPPPPSDGGTGTDFSPLIVAIIGIFTSAFFLVTLYLVFWECRRRRGQGATSAWGNWNQDAMVHDQPLQGPGGLDEAFIKSITVYKYKRNGVVEGTDCSVCLSEFEDGENLRVLPKCNHAFHLPCIDTWLRSHSSCPLCRFDIGSAKVLPLELPAEATQRGPSDHTRASALEVQTGNRSLAIRDLESGNGNVGRDVHRS